MEKPKRTNAVSDREQKKPRKTVVKHETRSEKTLLAEAFQGSKDTLHRDLFEKAGLAMFQVTREGKPITVNPEFARIFGYRSVKDFLTKVKNTSELFADPKRREEILRQKIENPSLKTFENLYLRKDGTTFTGQMTMGDIKSPDGRILLIEGLIEDITIRKQTEEALRESEQKLRGVLEQSTDGIVIADEQGTIIEWNRKQEEIMGYGKDESIGKPIWEAQYRVALSEDQKAHPPKQLKQFILKLLKERQSEFFGILSERTIRRKDGTVRQIESVIYPITIGDRFLIGSTTRDITERKQAEDALQQSEKKYRLLHESMIDGFVSVSMEGRILESNDIYKQMLGYNDAELSQKTFSDITPEKWLDYEADIVKNQIIKRGYSDVYEKEYIRKDGSIFPVELHTVLMRNGQGQPVGMWGIVRDITERKEAEHALRDSEERYRTLAEAANDNIFVVNREGRVEYINEYAAKQFHRKPEDILGEKMVSLFPPEVANRQIENLQRTFQTGEPYYTEGKTVFPQGEQWLGTWITPLFDESGDVRAVLGIARDITERRRVEDALRESDKSYRFLAENISDVIWILDAEESRFRYISPSVERLRGYSPEEVMAQDMAASLTPGSNQYLAHIFPDRIAEFKSGIRKVYIDEIEQPCKDGSSVWTETTTRYLINQGDGHLEVYGVSRDITARKQVELERQMLMDIMQGLTQTEELQDYLSLVHHTIAKVVFAKNFYVILKNKHTGLFEESYSVDEYDPPALPSLLEKSISSFVFRNGKPLLLTPSYFDELAARGEVKLVGAYSRSWLGVPLITSRETIGVMAVQDYDVEGRYTERDKELLYSIAGQVAQIVERKRAEEALRVLSTRQEALLASIPDILVEMNLDKKYTWANPAGFEFFGEDVIGKEAGSFIEGDQDFYREVQPLFDGDESTIYVESWQRRKDGQKRLLAWWCRTLKNDAGDVIGSLSSARDITEVSLAQEQVRRLNAELEQHVEARTHELRDAQEKLIRQEKLAVLGQLAGGVGHELRNPLGIINNAIYYLRLIQPDADDKIKEYLGIIETETRTADKIINDLLDFSRIKSVDREPIRIADLIKQTFTRFPAPDNVDVTVDQPEDLLTVKVDSHQMIQVLGNLVVNGCQAMSKGGQLIVQVTKSGNDVSIAVKDKGVGIPPENMGKLFEPLFTTKPKGIGLGLAVSKKLVEANGGRIEVQSEVGKGATFTVYLHLES
jgi:PAS domain S-box-containing protein